MSTKDNHLRFDSLSCFVDDGPFSEVNPWAELVGDRHRSTRTTMTIHTVESRVCNEGSTVRTLRTRSWLQLYEPESQQRPMAHSNQRS